jgi:hypothetical protein
VRYIAFSGSSDPAPVLEHAHGGHSNLYACPAIALPPALVMPRRGYYFWGGPPAQFAVVPLRIE